MTDIVERLREGVWGRARRADAVIQANMHEAADEIERLRKKCNDQAMILRRLNPENFPDTYFICGETGERDQNGMPKKILVAPAYGVDFAYEYVYNSRVSGPEW